MPPEQVPAPTEPGEAESEGVLPRFYAGRSVFVTGGSGFLGKVLVERLLWTCPAVSAVHLLLRAKRGATPQERLQRLKRSRVFAVLRARCPQRLERLHAVPGDCALPRLGLDERALAALQDVSVVLHGAATVRFDEELGVALRHNLSALLELTQLVQTALPRVRALVHVSTAYSNAERSDVAERVYPPPAPLRPLLRLAHSAPEELARRAPELIAPKPNTYTFSKAMAESALQEMRPRLSYPVAIFRPTIVVSSHRHPFPGWTENFNGPSGTVVGAGKGLLHAVLCRDTLRADLLPVDYAADALLAVAWETAADRPAEVRVYNCGSGDNPTTWRQFRLALFRHLRECPLHGALWHPFFIVTQYRLVYEVALLLLQTLPLYAAEYATRLLRVKTGYNLITAHKRLRAMNEAFSFFTLREWRFAGDGVRRVRARLSCADAALFRLDVRDIDWEEHFANFVRGTKLYALGECDDVRATRRRMDRLRLLHYCAVALLLLLLCRLLFALL